MSKRYFNCLYYADDKDIYDLMNSSGRKLSVARLIHIARQRGLYLSSKTAREDLVNYLVQQSFNWNQLSEILAETESPDRKEKMASRQLVTDVDLAALVAATNGVKDIRATSQDEVYSFEQSKDGKLQVRVQYSELDPSRNRLFQRRQKEIAIEALPIAGGFKLRYNSNEKSNAIVSDIISAISADKSKNVTERTITLNGISDPTVRTQFFIDLMRNLKGFSLHDVLSLKNHRTNEVVVEDGEKEDEDDDDVGLVDTKEADAVGIVKAIALSGKQVLAAPEYEFFKKEGFFIAHAVWHSVEDGSDGKCFEFEAEFANAERASDFRYSVKGYYERNEEGGFRKGRTPCREDEVSPLAQVLEESAMVAMETAGKSSEPKSSGDDL